ncbi:MAG TPA: serine hydrolase, partial [Chitinophaga sp.]|nr:serine hydrolase [Chitinophaga sp.]
EGLATGYTMNPEQPGTWKNNTWQNVIKGTPAGGGYSTAADLLKFANALQQHRFLNKGYTEIYTHGRVRYGKGLYGYGMSRDSVNGHVIIGHTGGHYGIANELMIYEDLGYTVVILTNGEVENYWEISNTLKNLLAGPSASTEGYFFTTRLVNTIREKGLQQALDEYKLKPAGIQLSESVIERSGAGELFNKQFDKAIAIFTFWITCFPHSANGYYNLAEAYRLTGNTFLAIENYKRYLEKEPEDTDVRGKMERLRL